MGLEHFIDGASSGREDAPKVFPVTLFGRSGVVTNSPEDKARNTKVLYSAEKDYQFAMRTPGNPASVFVAPQSAKDMVHEAIHHPAMDSVPGIDMLRASFDHNNNTHLDIRDELYTTKSGGMVGGYVRPIKEEDQGWGPPAVMRLKGAQQKNLDITAEKFPDLILPAAGSVNQFVVSHETSHLLGYHLNRATEHNVSHNWPMAKLHLHVVRTLFGKPHADALKHYYDKQGVDYGQSS